MPAYQQVSSVNQTETAWNNKVHNLIELESSQQCTVYKSRWFMLLLFFIFCVCSVMHIMQYTIIADIVVEYYGTTYTTVNWSFTIYLLAYIVFGFPATFLLQKLSLRTIVVLGMGMTCVGSWIKVGAASPERFWVAMLGQSIVAVSQVPMLPVPSKLAAVWFPPKEVSSACSIGVIGIEMGLALGFLVPPLFFHSEISKDDFSEVFYTMCISFSVLDSVFFLIILIFFKSAPPTPPSIAQSQISEKKNFFNNVKLYLNNRTNLLLVVGYGIAIGLLLAVSTLLNPIILNHYPNAHKDAGLIGLVMILAGSIGSFVSGVVLDRSGKFKQTVLLLSLLGIGAMLCYTFAISKGILFVYLTSAAFGFSTLGMQSAGLELGAELAYPIPEGIIAGILTFSTQAFGMMFTCLYSYLLETNGDFYANLTMLGIFLLQFILMCSIKYDLRRRAVDIIKFDVNGLKN